MYTFIYIWKYVHMKLHTYAYESIHMFMYTFMLLLRLSRFSRVQLCARQEHWSGLPFPSPVYFHKYTWMHTYVYSLHFLDYWWIKVHSIIYPFFIATIIEPIQFFIIFCLGFCYNLQLDFYALLSHWVILQFSGSYLSDYADNII